MSLNDLRITQGISRARGLSTVSPSVLFSCINRASSPFQPSVIIATNPKLFIPCSLPHMLPPSPPKTPSPAQWKRKTRAAKGIHADLGLTFTSSWLHAVILNARCLTDKAFDCFCRFKCVVFFGSKGGRASRFSSHSKSNHPEATYQLLISGPFIRQGSAISFPSKLGVRLCDYHTLSKP